MVVSDPLVKADAIVVLDGDYPSDERLLHAVKLWRSGYAPKVILSAKLAEWQTVEDYPSWRHARKLKVLPEDSSVVIRLCPCTPSVRGGGGFTGTFPFFLCRSFH